MPTRQTNSPIFIPGKASVFKAEPPPPFYYILTPNLAKVKTAALRVNPLSIPMERYRVVSWLSSLADNRMALLL